MYRRNFVKTGIAGMGALAFLKSARALNLDTAAEEKKWAVVYASKCGSTKKVAEWINEGMGEIADVIDVDTNPDIDTYDYFVIGGWINAGKLISNAKTFITNNKEALQPKIVGLFTVCGNAGKPVGNNETNNYLTKQIVEFSGVSDKPAKLFNGKSDPSCNGLAFEYDMPANNQDIAVAFGEEIYEPFKVGLRHAPAMFSPNQFGLSLRQGTRTNPVTAIAYNIPVADHVELAVCGLNGRTLATLVSGYQKANSYTINWDGGNLSAGHYLVRLKAGKLTATRKMVVYR